VALELALKSFLEQKVICWDTESEVSTVNDIIVEEPLSIRVQGSPYAIIMRTPGDEIEHAAGFCLAEGVVDTLDDFISIAFCDEDDTNVVAVTLHKKRRESISQILERRGFISQTSCGLCGKEIVEDLYQEIRPVAEGIVINRAKALRCLENLSEHQPMRARTKASHAAAFYSSDFEFLSAAEDVGRHNALDKAVGKLFLKEMLGDASVLTLSSRISYELVQKAARARIPVILAISRPTSLAVQLASQLNITLACLAPGAGLYIFNHTDRLQ
jgi:FdhD protein